MLKPVQQNLLKSVDELFESTLRIEFTSLDLLYEDNPKYQRVKKQNDRIVGFTPSPIGEGWTEECTDYHIAVKYPCEEFRMFMESGGDGKTYRGMYMIPEVVYIDRDDLFIGPFHPYLDKFQYYMDISFEAGLHQAWDSQFERVLVEHYIHKIEKRKIEDENQILDFVAIGPFFLILIFGYLMATFALFGEIFYHDCLARLSKSFIRQKLRRIFQSRLVNQEIY